MLILWKETCDQPRYHIQKQRHYFPNKALSGAALGITDKMEARLNPLSSSHRHSPSMKKLGLVILTFYFLSLVELAGNNVKVLERSMRKRKAFCSCAQKITYNH